MELPVLYFKMPDGSKLRASFRIMGFDWVYVEVAEQVEFLFWKAWKAKTNPHSGRSERLHCFIEMPKKQVAAWAERETLAYYEYAKRLREYSP